MSKKMTIFKKPKKKIEDTTTSPLEGWNKEVLDEVPLSPKSSVFGTYTRVVVAAADDSQASKKAFEYYILNVWKKEDLVVLVHCVQPPNLPILKFGTLAPPVEDWMKIMESTNRTTRKIEDEFTSLCSMKKIKNKMRICNGNKSTGESLCLVGVEEGASLLVCGREQQQGHLFKGSTVDYVLKHSRIPVLVVAGAGGAERSRSQKPSPPFREQPEQTKAEQE